MNDIYNSCGKSYMTPRVHQHRCQYHAYTKYLCIIEETKAPDNSPSSLSVTPKIKNTR